MAFSNILDPARYHGQTTKPPFFEGWYFKLVSADERHRFAIIPGVYKATDPQKSHSFIQVHDSESDRVTYHQYPIDAFKTAPDRFEIQIGSNTFTKNQVTLDIEDELAAIKGTVSFSGLTRWPVSFFSPGAMGWFAWVPAMECYHGVVSLDHAIEGGFIFNGSTHDFSDGRGYIEKDWGKQFPSAWIWGQSNHFNQSGTSLMISVAVVPWLGLSLGGFIIGFLHEGQLHRFTTYNFSKIEVLEIEDKEVRLVVKNGSHRLQVRAQRVEGGLFQAPNTVAMGRQIFETLNANLAV